MVPKTRQFPSKDGLVITADEYAVQNPKGYLLLCHRSHFNRGEYREIAPRLNALGYSCLAIDQRSGMKVLGTTNETYLLAKQQGLQTGYLAAKPDIEAAVAYCYQQHNNQPIILVGSSYSASLAICIASEDSQKIAAVVAFSPGEYLKGVEVSKAAQKLAVPTLVLSAKAEAEDVTALLKDTNDTLVTQYKPHADGAHGARALWAKTPGNEEYWTALLDFLAKRSSSSSEILTPR